MRGRGDEAEGGGNNCVSWLIGLVCFLFLWA